MFNDVAFQKLGPRTSMNDSSWYEGWSNDKMSQVKYEQSKYEHKVIVINHERIEFSY